MPYEKSDDLLSQLIDQVKRTDAYIAANLTETDYQSEELRNDVLGSSGAIWEAVNAEIRQRDHSEIQYQNAEREWQESCPPAPDARKLSNPMKWLNIISFVIILLYAAFVIFGALVQTHWTYPKFLFLLRAKLGNNWQPMIFLLIFFIVTYLGQRTFSMRNAIRLQGRQAVWKAGCDELSIKLSVPSLKTALAEVDAKILSQLTERVKAEIITCINNRQTPSFASRLEIKRSRGLAEVFDKHLTIRTPARDRLDFLFDSMPGGSIGIAGSRGAGKTTLLKTFCGAQRKVDQLKGKPIFGVLVSAPVAYEARDFLLYLFTTACQNLIVAEGNTLTADAIELETAAEELLDLKRLLRPLPTLLTSAGLLLIGFSIILSVLVALLPVPAVQSLTATTAAPNKPAAGLAVTAPAPAPPNQNAPRRISVAGKVGDLAGEWLASLQIEPAKGLNWGIAFVVAGLMLASFLGFRVWETFLDSINRLVRSSGFSQTQERRRRLEATIAARRNDSSALVTEARKWLKTTKFQQSFTSGWSGSLNLPAGIEGGVNRALTLAQNQLTLPEIGYFFTQFLDQVSTKYQVVVGIDELDKLASDELARRFINDIKSVFGLERCFYLVSVSEDALSSFERRGLPLRDEFDSAFDEFIYVDHLDFEHAKTLLQQRIVGRPVPFFALSYCMSGGLPRDLIRSFRNIIEVNEHKGATVGLSYIANVIITADLRSKLRAVSSSARKIKLEPDTDQFLDTLTQIEQAASSDAELAIHAEALLARRTEARSEPPPPGQAAAAPARMAQSEKAGEEEQARRQELNDISEEIATYILYVTLLRWFFTDQLNRKVLEAAIGTGEIDQLARARRLLSVNPAITRSMLTKIRGKLEH